MATLRLERLFDPKPARMSGMVRPETGGTKQEVSLRAPSPRYWRCPFDAETISIPRGDIHILKERCKGCAFCVEYCPTSVLQLSADFNSKGYHPPVAIVPGSCVQCGLCETICPDFAIFVTPHPMGSSGKGGE